MKENALWQQFISGDKKALSFLFKTYYEELYNYGLKLTGDQDFSLDTLQDLFLKLWKNRQHLHEVADVKPYLFKAYRNQLLDNLKMHMNTDKEKLEEANAFLVEFSHEDFIITRQLSKEKRENMVEALNKLSNRQREAVYLRYFEDLDFDTIASVMKTNVQSVRNTLHRAMVALRKIYLPGS